MRYFTCLQLVFPNRFRDVPLSQRSVALLIETSNAYARGLLDGIADYVRQNDAWSIYLPEQGRAAEPPSWLSSWEGDGIIARIETEAIAEAVKDTNLPVVDVSAARHLPRAPWVETDDKAIAQMAANHLIERGFTNLAFCGDSAFNWSIWRGQYFRKTVEDAGLKFLQYESNSRVEGYSWNTEKIELGNWLASLPHPTGVMACYDIKAQQLLDVSREFNISVPEKVAVLGVDNDRLLCDLSYPPLSSIKCNTIKTGFKAASILDRMMNGERIEAEAFFVQPLGVEIRQSTDVLAIEDEYVAAALSYIRENASFGINVSHVLEHVPVSRRILESRFRKYLGRTPHQEIARLRIEKVKQLLVESGLSLAKIAGMTGFNHEEYMSVAFKKATGFSPGRYRSETMHQPASEVTKSDSA